MGIAEDVLYFYKIIFIGIAQKHLDEHHMHSAEQGYPTSN